MKEAALDSPTFRSGFTHFAEQLDLVEKWLENYVRAITKLSHELGGFEAVINGFLAQTVTPTHVSEAVLDHDYTLLAMKRYGDGAKEFWAAAMAALRRTETNLLEPIRRFLQNDMRTFKETRRAVDQSQKQLDSLLSRYSSQSKTKEASALREDAFQVHEARKTYLKASMDFSVVAPQLRMALDKLLVKSFSDQWRDTRNTRQMGILEKWTEDIERVRGWSQEMESGEKTFRRELHNARRQIEESAELACRPSRELDDYAADAAAKARVLSLANVQQHNAKSRVVRAEKQGWLNLRLVTGKPSRTVWLRRWFYVKNGIFGWLVQGTKSGAVEESDRIGVLLCSVRPSSSDERRFVFEVKTKDTTIILQAETATELGDWLVAFNIAKEKALEDPGSTEPANPGSRASDPAFAISPPSAPEFAASAADSGMPQVGDEMASSFGVDRSSTLPILGADPVVGRSSFDVGTPRRSNFEKEEGTREKIMSKLELHRKPLGSGPGGIASLIAASHGSMPVGPGLPPPTQETPLTKKASALLTSRELPVSTLAPSTLANPPAPTNLSSTAVIVNGERGITLGQNYASGGIPSGLLANVWGSSNWGYLNRLERGELKTPGLHIGNVPGSSSPATQTPVASSMVTGDLTIPSSETFPGHRKTVSLDQKTNLPTSQTPVTLDFPSNYPVQLKTQDAQFRLLFPDAGQDERVVLVFKASWNLNGQQDFPGRVYVTPREIYFYSNHCGMTMTSAIPLDYFSEVTAAGGRECDFLYLHLKDESPSGFVRISVKTFLEPLRLLQRRLSFLVDNAAKREGTIFGLEEVMKALIKLEHNDEQGGGSSPSLDDWENVSINTPIDDHSTSRRQRAGRDPRDLRADVVIDRGLYANKRDGNQTRKEINKSFKLPKYPVVFEPAGMDQLAVEKEFSVSPKALFHVLFGDKSAVWQLLYHERHAQQIRMGPWIRPASGHIRREFEYEIEYLDTFRQIKKTKITDHQIVDSANEHLLYVVSDWKTPWNLPYRDDFMLLTKIVITHVAKSTCKLAIFTKVEWRKPRYSQRLIGRRALHDLNQDVIDVVDVVSDQCRRLGAQSRTKKAISVFGAVGVQTQVMEFAGSDSPLAARLRRSTKPHTLPSLMFESCASMAENVVTSAFQIIFRICRWVWRTVSANGIILCILAFSIVFNLVLSSRNATESWRERRAAKFMAWLGVGPDLLMTKAIYLNDLAEASQTDTILDFVTDTTATRSLCRDTFDAVMNLSNPLNSSIDDPIRPSQSPAPASWSSSSPDGEVQQQRRLRRMRHALGTQRHDLLVAMRVVNRIEEEMLRAEWETWLLHETAKCERIGSWIREQRLGANGQDVKTEKGDEESPAEDSHGGRQRGDSVNPERLTQLEAWHQSYCSSCTRDMEGIVDA